MTHESPGVRVPKDSPVRERCRCGIGGGGWQGGSDKLLPGALTIGISRAQSLWWKLLLARGLSIIRDLESDSSRSAWCSLPHFGEVTWFSECQLPLHCGEAATPRSPARPPVDRGPSEPLPSGARRPHFCLHEPKT